VKKLRRFEAVPLAEVINNPAVKPIANTVEKLMGKDAPYAVRGKYVGSERGFARDSSRVPN
jgi:hypothetical protein